MGRDSGLGSDRARAIFTEHVERFSDELRDGFPSNLTAASNHAGGWQERFAYEAIEEHASFFSERARRREGRAARKKAYDEMAVAFPAVTRLVAPLLLGGALHNDTVALDALELVVLHRKHTSVRVAHAHWGASNCGCTLNMLALVAHVHVAGERRCAVLGTRLLPFKSPLVRSIPTATEALLADLHRAATLLHDADAMRALLETPVVVDTLYAGGPLGRGPRNATNTEIVPGRTLSVLQASYRPRGAPPRPHLALAVPTDGSGDGPIRIAPASLEPTGGGWPVGSERFASAVAAVEATDAPQTGGAQGPCVERFAGPPPAEWWSVAARLRFLRHSHPVRLIARRAGERRCTMWVAQTASLEIPAGAIDAVMASRSYSSNRSTAMVGSPYDLWINRAYRHRAAGGLLLKGGASDGLRAGVSAAMDAAFTSFVLTAPPV